MFSTNVAGTSALIEVAAQLGCRAFVYTGTCSEYATPESAEPLDEYAPLAGATLYGASKAAAGLWGQALSQSLGMAFQWMRLFGVFGAGEASYRLLPHVAARLHRGESVPLTPGEQWRDFLYVEDTAAGLRLAAEAALDGRTGPFNLCSGRGVTVKWMAERIAALLGKPASLLEFGAMPYRPGEPLWLVGRAERFAAAAGFRPSLSIEDGLARVVEEISGRPSP
jgi:nucleoside-diphosphate-sugar epimerase